MATGSEWETGMGGDAGVSLDGGGLVSAIARRKGIVLVVLVFGLGLGYLYFLQAERVYQSSAQILIVKQEHEIPIAALEGATNYENTLSTHMLLAKSANVVEAAVRKHKLDQLAGLRNATDPVAVIAARLSAERAGGRAAPDPNVFEIRYRGFDPDECKIVLEAVIDSYKDSIGETYEDAGVQTLELINQAKDTIAKQLEEKQRAYREFRASSKLVPKSENGRNMHLVRMSEIEQERAALMRERSKTRAEAEAVLEIKRTGGNPESLTLIIGDSKVLRPSDEGRDPLQYRLYEAMVEERVLQDQYGVDHPKVKEIQTRIAMLREQLGGKAVDRRGEVPSFLDLYLEALRQEIQVVDAKLQHLDELYAVEQQAAEALEQQELEDAALRAEIEQKQQLFDTVMKRLDEASLIPDFGKLKADVIWPPSRGIQVQPNLLIVASIASVFSLLGGVILAYAVDMADTRFRDPEEIRREFGLPILGHVPVLGMHASRRQRKQSNLSPAVCTYFHPAGRDAEAYRNVRTSLLFNRQRRDMKVFQVTSPLSGDGKSTLSANLAVSLAQSGKVVLLIDADMRRPCAHSIFGVTNKHGLSDLLADNGELADVVAATEIPNLSLLPSGPSPANPAELLVSSRFSELIDVVREKFDFVIVDSPPVLPVSDPATISPIVDATLLVLHLNKQVRRSASDALDILIDVGANVLGLVINGVAKKSYNSRYYGYGDRYEGRNGYYYSANRPRHRESVAQPRLPHLDKSTPAN